MNFTLLALILALIWASITGEFGLPNLLLGGIVAFVALWFVRDRLPGRLPAQRLRRILSLALLFFYELALSAVRVAWLVVSPNLKSKLAPAFIAFPLTAKSDEEITLLANLITLTPGTLSVAVSDDRKFIYVHALSVDDRDALVESIASGFEAKIIEAFK